MAENHDEQLTRWFDELEANASRFNLEDSRREIIELRESSHKPHALAIAGEALRAESVTFLIAQLSALLKERYEVTIVPPAEGVLTPVLFVETLEFGSLRREVLNTLALLDRRKRPLLLLIAAVPPRPPSVQEPIVREIRTRLRGAGVELLELIVCDPTTEGSVEHAAGAVGVQLQRVQSGKLRSRLLPVTRRVVLALRASADAGRLDLDEIEARERQLRFDKEIIEARLTRALRAMRAHLESELPHLARPILDRLHDESAQLADAALGGAELFGAALERISARVVESTLSAMLPRIVDGSVAIFSETVAKEIGSAAASITSAASLTAESVAEAARLDGDELLTVIRWHGRITNVIGPVINQYPAAAILGTLLTAGSKFYLKSIITDAIERLNEPLRQKLAAIAGSLADSGTSGLRKVYFEPIDTLESALRIEAQRKQSARSAATPAREFAEAIRMVEKLRGEIERWQGR